MILYCDSSALIKLYINEEYSDFMRQLLEKADAIATVRARLSGESFGFACFDSRLKKAAAVLGVFHSEEDD
jgi:hypothetical protein